MATFRIWGFVLFVMLISGASPIFGQLDFSTPLVFDGIKKSHLVFHHGSIHILADCIGGGGPQSPADNPNDECDLPSDIGQEFLPLGNITPDIFVLKGDKLRLYQMNLKTGLVMYGASFHIVEEE